MQHPSLDQEKNLRGKAGNVRFRSGDKTLVSRRCLVSGSDNCIVRDANHRSRCVKGIRNSQLVLSFFCESKVISKYTA